MERGAPQHKTTLLDLWPWLLGGPVFLILLEGWNLSSGNNGAAELRGMALVVFLTLATVSYRRWARAANHARNRAYALRLFGITALSSLLVLISGVLPFVLWAIGWIPWHTAALLLAAAVISFVVRSASRQIQPRTSI